MNYISYPRILDGLLELGYDRMAYSFLPPSYAPNTVAVEIFKEGYEEAEFTATGTYGLDALRHCLKMAEQQANGFVPGLGMDIAPLLIGQETEEPCPRCGCFLYRNDVKDKWCSSEHCNFGGSWAFDK